MALSALNWLLALLVIVGEATADQKCFPQRTSIFKFRLTSYSNQTGLRFFTIGLESEASNEDAVILDVNHWTGMCGGAETVGVQVDVTTPTHLSPEPFPTSTTTRLTTEGAPHTTGSPSNEVPVASTTTAKPVADCWPGYELLPGVGCYKEVKERMNWKQAHSLCIHEGAQLAVPKSQQEMDFFNRIAARPDGQSPWLGIFKAGGEWRTVDGTVIPETSSLWEPGEPSGNGKCGAVWEIGGLDDRGCNAWVRAICQQL